MSIILELQPNSSGDGRVTELRIGTPEGLRRSLELHDEVKLIRLKQGAIAAPAVSVIGSNGIVNDASFRPQISPGSLFSIFGTGMASTTASGFPFPLPTTVNGTNVRVNGIPAPLVYLSPNQINAQVPVDVIPGTATVTVTFNGSASSANVPVLSSSPGLFMTDYKTRTVLQRTDGTLVSQSNPASAGEAVVLYGTGIGSVTPPIVTGQPARGDPNLSRANSSVQILINGVSTPVDFAGLTPGFAGLMQINTRIPQNMATSDDVPVVVTINGIASQSSFINVRAAVATRPNIISFASQPQGIVAGQSSTLSWNVGNATSVSIDNGIGVVASVGTRAVFPSSTTNYKLTASNSSASVSSTVTVAVNGLLLPTIAQFTADDVNLQSGQSTTLRWAVDNGAMVAIDNGIGTVDMSGSRTVTPNSSVTYTLTAKNSAGSSVKSVFISVTNNTPSCPTRGGAPVWNSDIVQYTGTLNKGDWQTAGFSLSSTSTVVLKNLSDYQNQTAIVTADQLPGFKSGGSYSGYASFDGTYGIKTATLPAGQYYVASRYLGSGTSHLRFELDGQIQLPGTSFVDYYLNDTAAVGANGGYVIQPFTIQCGFRYLLDGANSGVEAYVIPASEIANFKNKLTFLYYPSYSGPENQTDEDQPDDYEVKLPLGDYALVYRNTAMNTKYAVYTMSRWQ